MALLGNIATLVDGNLFGIPRSCLQDPCDFMIGNGSKYFNLTFQNGSGILLAKNGNDSFYQ